MIVFVVSYSQCNVLTGHHCVLEIIWSVISWYLSYHLSFQKNKGVLNFFLCVYYTHLGYIYVCEQYTFVTRLTRRVPLVEQELLRLPEHLSSPPNLSGVRFTRSLVSYVCFVDRCLSFYTFSFDHYVVCFSLIYGFWLLLLYLQTLLHIKDTQWNLQSVLYEQLPFIYRLKLYALFIKGKMCSGYGA